MAKDWHKVCDADAMRHIVTALGVTSAKDQPTAERLPADVHTKGDTEAAIERQAKRIAGQGKRQMPTRLGIPNRLRGTVREAFENAFHALQDDPKANLIAWGKKRPGDFYTLAARLIPAEIQASVHHTLDLGVLARREVPRETLEGDAQVIDSE